MSITATGDSIILDALTGQTAELVGLAVHLSTAVQERRNHRQPETAAVARLDAVLWCVAEQCSAPVLAATRVEVDWTYAQEYCGDDCLWCRLETATTPPGTSPATPSGSRNTYRG
jgi:hypothetical protein